MITYAIVVLEFTLFTESGVMLSGTDHLGKNCSHDSFYTLTHDAKCNGWEGISYADCQRKCILNELPTPCKNHPNVSAPSSGCGFASWNRKTQWCHLAGNYCILSPDPDSIVWETFKIGNDYPGYIFLLSLIITYSAVA